MGDTFGLKTFVSSRKSKIGAMPMPGTGESVAKHRGGRASGNRASHVGCNPGGTNQEN